MQHLSSDDYCSEIVSYTLNVSSGTFLSVSGGETVLSNCSGTKCVFEPNSDLSMRIKVANTINYAATMKVCTEMVCRAVTTPFSESTVRAQG